MVLLPQESCVKCSVEVDHTGKKSQNSIHLVFFPETYARKMWHRSSGEPINWMTGQGIEWLSLIGARQEGCGSVNIALNTGD